MQSGQQQTWGTLAEHARHAWPHAVACTESLAPTGPRQSCRYLSAGDQSEQPGVSQALLFNAIVMFQARISAKGYCWSYFLLASSELRCPLC